MATDPSLSSELLSPNTKRRREVNIVDDSSTALSNMTIDSPQSSRKLTCLHIETLLKSKPDKYIVVENTGRHTSTCWKTFGFPVRIDENGTHIRLTDFVSCKMCHKTYSYVSSSTRNLNNHFCQSSTSELSTAGHKEATSQLRLTAFYSRQNSKPKSSDTAKMKELQAQWICQNVRPFSIVEDSGFVRLAQELVAIGARYGNIDVNQILRGADTITAYVAQLADQNRVRITEQLLEPLVTEAATFCPDMWMDPVRRVAYLGIDVIFVDESFNYKTYDLCCAPFEECDKSADSIIASLKKELNKFGITTLSGLKFVSDRGSNFVKALKNYRSYFCFAHRMNNILVTCFYQQKTTTKTKTNILNDINVENFAKAVDDFSNIEPIDDDNYHSDVRNSFDVENIPLSAKEVLKILHACKELVKYVKINGLNKEIKAEGGITLCQSTKVRWLSIVELLVSIDRSYSQIKKVMQNRRKAFLIDRLILKQLIRLLRPFKHILKIVQKGKEPTIHLILICIFTLRSVFSSYDNLNKFNEEYNDSLAEKLPEGEESEWDFEESEGVRFFRIRLLNLIDSMFQLEPIHYAATFLHPRYRLLRSCSYSEVVSCKSFVRLEVQKIIERQNLGASTVTQTKTNIEEHTINDPPIKKLKRFGQEFESGQLSDEYEEKSDELEMYLAMKIDPETLVDNPLNFWAAHCHTFPRLSILARQIYSIPATTADVERQFSVSGQIVTNRRSSISPENLNNILFLRSTMDDA